MDEVKLNTDLSKFCIECGDQDADVFCQECQDQYCSICWGSLHKRGTRAQHNKKKITVASIHVAASVPNVEMKVQPAMEKLDLDAELRSDTLAEFFTEPPTPDWFEERARFIPLRLSDQERTMLALVESSMDVSEYTDKVDVWTYRSKANTIINQLKDLCGIVTGLTVISDPKSGKTLAGRVFKDNADLFQHVFEVARRHKIRNPEKMRTTYGKLIHVLMDCQDDDVKRNMEFEFVRPVKTVYSTLAEKEGGLAVLQNKLLPLATVEIMPFGKTPQQLARCIEAKKKALEGIVAAHTSPTLSADEIRGCVASICDNHSFLASNREPVDRMIWYLTNWFSPSGDGDYSLDIRSGRGGSCLSHDHRTQYFFAMQSLTLWREICHNMFRLWCFAEGDLLDETSMYRLSETGQGLQRMQRCPRVWRAMSEILQHTHAKVRASGLGNWVGLSVVHLGDRDVPNALVFIDKYNQIARILTPIVTTLRELERLYNSGAAGFPNFKEYLDKTFGGLTKARMMILQDFFKHGFDGSGDDGGSCIDGRLTSCWNWCSLLSKKPYYSLFLLTGFMGFDGEF